MVQQEKKKSNAQHPIIPLPITLVIERRVTNNEQEISNLQDATDPPTSTIGTRRNMSTDTSFTQPPVICSLMIIERSESNDTKAMFNIQNATDSSTSVTDTRRNMNTGSMLTRNQANMDDTLSVFHKVIDGNNSRR